MSGKFKNDGQVAWRSFRKKQMNATRKSRGAKRSSPVAAAVYAAGDGRCYLCGISLVVIPNGHALPSGEKPDNLFTVDHLTPVSRGGTHDLDNLRACCWKCNKEKGNAPPSGEFCTG